MLGRQIILKNVWTSSESSGLQVSLFFIRIDFLTIFAVLPNYHQMNKADFESPRTWIVSSSSM